MNVVDSKGTPIQVGSHIQVKGSKIIRVVCPGLHGSSELHVSSGKIQATRVDNNAVSWSAWIDPKKCVVVA